MQLFYEYISIVKGSAAFEEIAENERITKGVCYEG